MRTPSIFATASALVAVSGIGQVDAAAAAAPGSLYAPISVACPSNGSINRAGPALSTSETAYVASRKPKADKALAAWIKQVDPSFNTSSLPVLGVALSGGGYRAMLSGAGVVQAFDARDSKAKVAGILQGTTYIGALSGGRMRQATGRYRWRD